MLGIICFSDLELMAKQLEQQTEDVIQTSFELQIGLETLAQQHQ
jgi:hypothetical protein